MQQAPRQCSLNSETLHNPLDIEHSYSLRYQVYCVERNFLDKQHYPAQKELDAFDKRSLHFGVYAQNRTMLGSVRMVFSDNSDFPITNHCALDIPTSALSMNEGVAEISRLVLTRNKCSASISNSIDTNAALLLYKRLYQESKRRGIKHWLAAMEPALVRLLRRFNFNFQPIGPVSDYYGYVRPYIAHINEVEQQVKQRSPKLFQSFIEDLEPEYRPNNAHH